MARWIAFDQETTSFLRSALAQGTRIDTLLRGPVDYALARPSAVVAVLPASGSSSSGNRGIPAGAGCHGTTHGGGAGTT